MTSRPPVFTVSAEVFDRWPGYIVGCVLIAAANNCDDPSEIEAILRAAEDLTVARLEGRDPRDLTEIAPWRSAFRECGWAPSKYLSSVEAIVKRVGRDHSLPRINPIVDLANGVSLRTLCPIGAHDIGALGGNVLTVRASVEGDEFLPMGDAPAETPDRGEIVYAAGSRVRTRRWVWRQSRDALIGPQSTNVFFPIDGFAPETWTGVHEAIELLSNAGQAIFGCKVTTGLVDRRSPSFPS